MCKRLPIKTLIVQSACDVKGVFGRVKVKGKVGRPSWQLEMHSQLIGQSTYKHMGRENNSNAKINRLCAERSICSGKTNFCDCFLNGGQHLL